MTQIIAKSGFVVEKNVPGIPFAPLGRIVLTSSDYDYIERKRQLASKLPFYTMEEVARRKNPYYIVLLHDMMEAGYRMSVKEMAQLLRRAEKTTTESGMNGLAQLIGRKEKVYMIADLLRAAEEYEHGELYETAAMVRRELGQKLMKDDDLIMAKHFLRTALLVAEKAVERTSSLDRLRAEIHCLLAFIARDHSENLEAALESAVSHLVVCRELSRDQSWHFPPSTLSIRLKKPISLHGLREDYEILDACSMSLYMIATLLEHEMMLGLANQILHSHKYPSDQDIAQSHAFADAALRLAFEVHLSVALSSALLRFGIVLRHAGEYEDAIKYFTQLSNHSEISADNETFAIAQHNIAMTHMAKHRSMEALECLARQKEIADKNGLVDLQADAMQEIGLILLQEGQLWEAEECYAAAYEGFKSVESEKPTKSYIEYCERNFVMWGIAAGQQLWSRFAGLARAETTEAIDALVDWKCRRSLLPKVPRPDYRPDRILDVYRPYHLVPDVDDNDEELEKSESLEEVTSLISLPSDTAKQTSSGSSILTEMELANMRKVIRIQSVETGSHSPADDEYFTDYNHSPEEDDIRRKEFAERRERTRSGRPSNRGSSVAPRSFGNSEDYRRETQMPERLSSPMTSFVSRYSMFTLHPVASEEKLSLTT